MGGDGNGGFGTCCETLGGAMSDDEFDPLISVGDDGILYLAVGSVIDDDDDEDAAIVEHPVFFCPFCGTKVQDPDEVAKKLGGTEQ